MKQWHCSERRIIKPFGNIARVVQREYWTRLRETYHNVNQTAKASHPAHWSRGTKNWKLPTAVTLNVDKKNRHNAHVENHAEKLAA